jgi:hypothetical protein
VAVVADMVLPQVKLVVLVVLVAVVQTAQVEALELLVKDLLVAQAVRILHFWGLEEVALVQ